jgi:ribosomal protein S7
MTRHNGKTIEEPVEVGDSDRGLGSTQSLRRLVDEGERYFWSKRGIKMMSWTMREEIFAAATTGASERKKRERIL